MNTDVAWGTGGGMGYGCGMMGQRGGGRGMGKIRR